MSGGNTRPSTGQEQSAGEAAAEDCLLEIQSSDVVEQVIDGVESGLFLKEVLRAPLASGRVLSLVRKAPARGDTRGAVILIHGFAQNRYSWHLSQRSLVNFLAARGLDTYNLELAGHGRSRDYGTPPARAFSEYISDCAEIIAAVSRHSGHSQVFLAGHSLGGAVCYGAAPRCPERVAGVITFGGVYLFGQNRLLFHIAKLVSTVDRRSGLLRRFGLGMKTEFLGKVLVALLPVANEISWSFPVAGWVPGSTEPEVIEERILRGFDWTGLNVFLTMMGWAAESRFDGEDGSDYAAEFAALDRPLLVIAGNEDRLATPDDVRPAWENSASSDKTYREFSPVEDELHWGHLDIVLGAKASTHVWPLVSDWILERC